MIKKILTLIIAMMTTGTIAQAASHTTTFTRNDFTQKGQTCTYTDNVAWTNDGVWKNFDLYGAYFGWSSTKALQFGSTSNPCSEFSLTSASFAGKVITKVTVNTSTGTSAEAECSVRVGDTSYGSHALTTDPTDYEFTGSASGDIVVAWTQSTERALYVKTITVDYEDAATELSAPVVQVSQSAEINFDPILVTITADDASIYYTLDGTTPTAESTLYTAPFQLTQNATIKAVAVKGTTVSPVSDAITLTFGRSVADIAAFIALADDPDFDATTFVRIESDVVATFYNRKNLFVQDATGSLLLNDTYSRYTDRDINNGDIIAGGFYGRVSATTPLKQMTHLNGITDIAAGQPVAPIEIKVADISETNVNQYVRIRGVKTTAPVARSFVIAEDDEMQIEAYNQFNIDMSTVDTEKSYDIIGIISYSFDPIVYPIEFIESEPTGILAITTSIAAPVYNIAGQRVSKTAEGIKIIGGKKVVR